MPAIDFYTLLLGNVTEFLLWNLFCFVMLYIPLRRILKGGFFDPMFLVFVVGFSTNYAVVLFLFSNDLVSIELFLMVLVYAFLFILLFSVFTLRGANPFFRKYVNIVVNGGAGTSTFVLILSIYMVISAYLITQIGFGFFADSNRFENSRGFGAFVRILDLCSVFIISYGALYVAGRTVGYYKLLGYLLISLFVLYSSIINGAKISVIFALITIVFSLKLEGYIKRVGFIKVILIGVFGFFFVLAALWVNLVNNDIEVTAESENISGVPVVVDRLFHRIVANGNTSYLLLPNNVIDLIEKDSALVRFLTPVVGITQMSRVMGYNVGDYSVGRQALLHYHRDVEVSGGPTSHFDYFSYVYFGYFGGLVFVSFLAYLLAGMGSAIIWKSKNTGNIYFSALLVTLWVRGVIVIVEPTVGLAYLFDAIVFFTFISFFVNLLKFSIKGFSHPVK